MPFAQKPPLYGGDCNQPIAAILDDRFRNLDSVKTRGVDVALDYSNDTARGKWVYGLNGTYIFDQKQQITPYGAGLRSTWIPSATHCSLRLARAPVLVAATLDRPSDRELHRRYRDPGSVPGSKC